MAPVTFSVTADTSVLTSGTSGYIDFQFNPTVGLTPPPATATATVTSLSVIGGFLNPGSVVTYGDVSGDPTLPPGLILTNTDTTVSGSNEYKEGITFGSTLSFDVTFRGDSPTSTLDLNSFFFLILDKNGASLTTDTSGNGLAAQIDLVPNGTSGVTPVVTPWLVSPGGSVIVAPGTSPNVGVVPEPSAMLLFSGTSALLGLSYAWRRRQRFRLAA